MRVKQYIKQIIPRKLWAKARLIKLRYIVQNYSNREVSHIYGDSPLTVLLSDPLAEGWYDHDWPELREITLLKNHRLKPGATIFDLGAHQCVVALMLSKAVGPTGKVIALEANAHNAEIGRRNCKLNNAEHLTVLYAAAAETSGTLMFNDSWNGQVEDSVKGQEEWGQTKVKSVCIDDLARQYGVPDVLFIDVEGFECNVLRGAKSVLATGPDCFIEVHKGEGLEKFGGSAETVTEFFPRDEYDLYIGTEEIPFSSMLSWPELPESRFFLVAISKQSK